MAVLQWVDDPDRLYPIMGKVIAIGRSYRNDIVLDDTKVSRHHARIEERAGKYYVIDMESTNGIFVNGQQVAEEVLTDGCKILIGMTDLIFKESETGQEKLLSEKLRDLASEQPAERENLARKLRVFSRKIEQMEKSDRLSALLLEITRRLTSILDVKKLLAQTMDDLVKLTKAERGLIVLYDFAKRKLAPAIARGIGKDIEADERDKISYGIVKEVFQSGVPVLTTDAQDDPRFSAGQSVFSFNIRSVMCAPLKTKDKTLGVIYIDNRQESGMFSDVDLRFLEAFAAQSAVALENAMLYREIMAEKKKIESILESMDDAMVVTDKEGSAAMMNPSAKRLFGIDNESDQKPGDRSNRLSVLLSEIADVDESTTFDIFTMKPNHEMFSNRVTVLKRENEKRAGSIMALRNITQLKDVHRSSIRFLHMVASHLDKELTAIESDMKQGESGPSQDHLQAVRESIQRIFRFARMIAGPIRLYRKVAKPADLLETILPDVHQEAEKSGVTLVLGGWRETWSDDTPLDPDKMAESIRIVLCSAIELVAEGSTIKADFSSSGKEKMLQVESPSLVPPVYIRRVLESSQLKTEMVDAVESVDELTLMVDLAYSRFVVDAHGGTLEFEKDDTIRFSFPVLNL